MHVMIMRIGPIVGTPPLGGTIAIEDLAVPDDIRHPRVQYGLTRKSHAVDAMGGVMREVERVAIVVIAFNLRYCAKQAAPEALSAACRACSLEFDPGEIFAVTQTLEPCSRATAR